MAIADYLRKLVELRNQLVANLKSMGVAADESEKLNTLVPKVLQCETKQNVEFVEGANFAGSGNAPGLLRAISKINIPNSITRIGNYAFIGCTNLISITISDSVTTIGNYAFENCSSLASITIPDSVTSIGSHAFNSCTSLASVTIGNGVTSIGSHAFNSCTSLASVTIGNGVTSIEFFAFYNCTSLAHIYYTGTKTQWDAITKGGNWNYNMGSNVSGGTTIHYNYVPE